MDRSFCQIKLPVNKKMGIFEKMVTFNFILVGKYLFKKEPVMVGREGFGFFLIFYLCKCLLCYVIIKLIYSQDFIGLEINLR